MATATTAALTTIAALPEHSLHESLAVRADGSVGASRTVVTQRRADDALYRDAERAFGPTGVDDITAVMGVDQTVGSMLALFEVPAPR